MNVIAREQVKDWLAKLTADHAVIAPTRVAEDLTLYGPIHSPDAVAFEHTRTPVSLKEYFLPATEAILTIERVRQAAAGGGPVWEVNLRASEPEHDQVIFGAHPCDVQALLVLDALLLRDPVDTYYAQRREKTTLVGVACAQMEPTCLCTSMGSAPDDARGMDVMLYPDEGKYLLEALTPKGHALIGDLHLDPYAGRKPERTWPPAGFRVPPRTVWTRQFDDPQWGRLADRCLSCRICTFICPTCRCFDIRDYTVAQKPGYQKIERLRCWDSCMAEGYRRIAGGHNPRATTEQRLRNRFFCKFVYYPADFGPTACVGCGRCIDLCPVNVDIGEVIETVAARAAE